MKTLKFLTVAVSLFFVSSVATAQTTDEHHKKITEHHTTIKKKTEELQNGKATDKKVHTEEIGKSIEGAKKEHSMWESKMTVEQKNATKAHHDSMRKHHENATASHKALKEETIKTTPNETKIKEHASNINKESGEAEKDNLEIKKKISNK